ncbi:hypothetical protein KJI95_12140 [Shewanella sp. JM162201]|uniref:Uncharacterized protein n=1 Tax=Shewanella jiangmenensis TaxID=2837387 RepID=A0ABS5V484_9GAMM|nr:hypothetical protein [Shewanella jiangmenensis]MBT1445272.1 hypothetical protein [Shewanella jiangmenensis]
MAVWEILALPCCTKSTHKQSASTILVQMPHQTSATPPYSRQAILLHFFKINKLKLWHATRFICATIRASRSRWQHDNKIID